MTVQQMESVKELLFEINPAECSISDALAWVAAVAGIAQAEAQERIAASLATLASTVDEETITIWGKQLDGINKSIGDVATAVEIHK